MTAPLAQRIVTWTNEQIAFALDTLEHYPFNEQGMIRREAARRLRGLP